MAFPLSCIETPASCEANSIQLNSPIAAENMDGPAPAPDGSSVLFSADYNGLLRLRPTGAIDPLTAAGVRAFAPVKYWVNESTGFHLIRYHANGVRVANPPHESNCTFAQNGFAD
jgi:hypothetical protein